ncbi:4433_t:CDS:1, partial [Acaulospora colombiana]
FTELLSDKEDYNVIIEAGTELNKKSFTAHSAVLRYRSSYFRKELTNIVANEKNIKTIVKS